MPFEQTVVRMPVGIHRRVTVVKLAMEQETNRQVTYGEVIGYLVTHWETVQGLAASVREASR